MPKATEPARCPNADPARTVAGARRLRTLLTWATSLIYDLEWKDDGDLLLRWPSTDRQTRIPREQVDYVLARLFGP